MLELSHGTALSDSITIVCYPCWRSTTGGYFGAEEASLKKYIQWARRSYEKCLNSAIRLAPVRSDNSGGIGLKHFAK